MLYSTFGTYRLQECDKGLGIEQTSSHLSVYAINGIVINVEEGSGILRDKNDCDNNRSLDAKTVTDIETQRQTLRA